MFRTAELGSSISRDEYSAQEPLLRQQLLDLQRDSQRQSQHARALVLEKCRDIEERIAQLRDMQTYLQDLAARCRGDEGPDCAILDELSHVSEGQS